MMSEAILMLQSSQSTSCSHEVISRLGKWHISNCTCCELSKEDLVILDDLRMAPTMDVTCIMIMAALIIYR